MATWQELGVIGVGDFDQVGWIKTVEGVLELPLESDGTGSEVESDFWEEDEEEEARDSETDDEAPG